MVTIMIIMTLSPIPQQASSDTWQYLRCVCMPTYECWIRLHLFFSLSPSLKRSLLLYLLPLSLLWSLSSVWSFLPVQERAQGVVVLFVLMLFALCMCALVVIQNIRRFAIMRLPEIAVAVLLWPAMFSFETMTQITLEFFSLGLLQKTP